MNRHESGRLDWFLTLERQNLALHALPTIPAYTIIQKLTPQRQFLADFS